MDAEESLGKVALFGGLKRKQIKSLAKMSTTRSFEPGRQIVREGQMGVGLYCILSGRVRVTVEGASGDRVLRTMGPGESFGELALLDDQPRSATVTAIERTDALLLDKAQFLAELHTYPEIALEIIPVLVKWLRESEHEVARAGG